MLYYYNIMKKSDKKTEKKAKESKKTSEPMSVKQQLMIKIVLLFIIFGALVFCVIFGGHYLYSAICTRNSNYIVRNFQLRSTGYWNNRGKEVAELLKIKLNEDNIFRLDTKKIQQEALKINGVKSCIVKTRLPDTLELEMIERIPRARFLSHPDYLIDEEGVVLLKRYSPVPVENMPLVLDFDDRSKLVVNNKINELANAMQILYIRITRYSDIEIHSFCKGEDGQLIFMVRYKGQSAYSTAIMPDSLEGIDIRMKALRTALIRSIQQQDHYSVYNLSFDGRVVCE